MKSEKVNITDCFNAIAKRCMDCLRICQEHTINFCKRGPYRRTPDAIRISGRFDLNVFITHQALVTSNVDNFDASVPVLQNQNVDAMNQFHHSTHLRNLNNFFSYFVYILEYNWMVHESSFSYLIFLSSHALLIRR